MEKKADTNIETNKKFSNGLYSNKVRRQNSLPHCFHLAGAEGLEPSARGFGVNIGIY